MQIIQYIVTPVLGIKTNWVTEITHVVDKQYFVDEQLTVANLLPQAGPRPAMRKPIPGARHSEGTR